MECNKFKLQYGLKYVPCCESCHEDDSSGFGEDLWFEVEGIDWNICCRLIVAYELRPTQKTNEISK